MHVICITPMAAIQVQADSRYNLVLKVFRESKGRAPSREPNFPGLLAIPECILLTLDNPEMVIRWVTVNIMIDAAQPITAQRLIRRPTVRLTLQH